MGSSDGDEPSNYPEIPPEKEIRSPSRCLTRSPSSTLNETSGRSQNVTPTNQLGRITTVHDGEAQPTINIAPTISGPPYSIFSKKQKRFIVFLAAFGASFSPISGNIYFPALNPIGADLHVSNAKMNLTLTTYMIFQGLAPSLMGDLADTAGRRPAYLLCLIIYIAACIGLALQNSYAALLVLRCLQSAGSSATLALASGIVGDISTAAERGTYQGIATIGSQLGPSLGPVLGGILAQFLGWRSIFWFLIILAVVFLIPFTLFFPETSRNVVGNGSIPPQTWNMTLTSYMKLRRLRRETQAGPASSSLQPMDTRSSRRSSSRKLRLPNPLASFRILSDLTTFMLLGYNAFLFVCFYYILSSLPPQYAKIYGFNTLQVGLCYIPFGIGGSSAALLHGRILDWNFRRTARKLGVKVDRKRQTDLLSFPIEKARLQISLPLLYVALSLLLIYGWVLDIHSPLAAPLILLFPMGYCITSCFNTCQTLLVDFHPTQPSTATAANNLLRCLLGAGSLAILDPLLSAIGVGGTFSLLVGILVAFSPVLWILYFKGMMLRQKRFARMTEKERTKDADLDNDLNIQHHDENIRGENDGTTAPVAIGGLMEVEGLREVEKEIQDDIEADGKDGR